MLFASRLWTALGLLVVGAKDSYGSAIHDSQQPYYNMSAGGSPTRTLEPAIPSHTSASWPSSKSIVISIPAESKPSSNYHYSVSTPGKPTLQISSPVIQTWPSKYPSSTSSTPCSSTPPKPTVPSSSTTCIESTPSSQPIYVTTSSSFTTTTTYISTTITPPPPPPPDPCPTFCSISAGTVNLIFWPTDEPYTYPPTYVDTALDYTFTSPSVYMIVNTLFGYNSAGRAGPSGTNVIFALDLDQVSTIVPSVSATQQLTLNDLGTDCPQSEAASVIATAAPDGRCDPILAAPDPVRSWALPCNACGRFGLFDPPYAVPPLAGGLVPAPTPQPTSVAPSTHTTTTSADTISIPPTPSSVTTSHSTTIAVVTTASAARITGGLASLILSLFVSVCLL